MTPVAMFRHKGFLIRIVDNECYSYRYEWTIDGILPSTKSLIRRSLLESKKYHKKIASMRTLQLRYDQEMIELTRKRRLNNVLKRLYDPTSMPTARGVCSAQDYAYEQVDLLTTRQPQRPRFTR